MNTRIHRWHHPRLEKQEAVNLEETPARLYHHRGPSVQKEIYAEMDECLTAFGVAIGEEDNMILIFSTAYLLEWTGRVKRLVI